MNHEKPLALFSGKYGIWFVNIMKYKTPYIVNVIQL